MNRIWNILKNVELTFWLLLVVTIMFITGSLYSRADYHLLESLNNVPIHEWFVQRGFDHIDMTWWIPVLVMAMALLTLNTLVCAVDRLAGLWPKRGELPQGRFLALITPSLIHILFILILCGHVLTFTVIHHERYAVEIGNTYRLPDNATVTVRAIDLINYPEGTPLADRLMNGSITLSVTDRPDTQYRVGFLSPVRLNGAYLHIEAAKRDTGPEELLYCNRGEVRSTADLNPQIFLLYTEDPGLSIIVVFLFIMIVLLGFYYGSFLVQKDRQASQE